MTGYQDGLTRVIDEVVAPRAVEIDAAGEFPRDAISALGKEGILGLTVSAELGGGGGSLADAADVVRQLGRGVRLDGDGRADALRRRRC